jgi:hypothetical protein
MAMLSRKSQYQPSSGGIQYAISAANAIIVVSAGENKLWQQAVSGCANGVMAAINVA